MSTSRMYLAQGTSPDRLTLQCGNIRLENTQTSARQTRKRPQHARPRRSLLSYLPGLVMIISVPMSWKVFQSSGSSRVSLMLPCRYASGAIEGGAAPLKPGFKSADQEKLSKSRFLEGKKRQTEETSPLTVCMLQRSNTGQARRSRNCSVAQVHEEERIQLRKQMVTGLLQEVTMTFKGSRGSGRGQGDLSQPLK